MLVEILRRKSETFSVVWEARDGAEALALVALHQPDLLLLDYEMPSVGRLSNFCQEVVDKSSATRILLVSGYAGEKIALEAAVGGVLGYVLKGASITDLLQAITTVQEGGIWIDPRLPPPVFRAFLGQVGKASPHLGQLSRQELHILSFVSQGLSNKEISSRLYISEKTVKNHLTHIFDKLGVTNREQAALVLFAGEKTGESIEPTGKG
jgi:DNA-binding NarL/FixJ family response regulator